MDGCMKAHYSMRARAQGRQWRHSTRGSHVLLFIRNDGAVDPLDVGFNVRTYVALTSYSALGSSFEGVSTAPTGAGLSFLAWHRV